MRLIDADALLNENRTDYPDVPFDALGEMVEWFTKIVDEQPTVAASPWHRVEERLPNVDEKVLVFAVGKLDGFIGDTVIALTSMSDTNWLNHHEKVDEPYWLDPWQYFLTDYRITHWMPLPEPPTGTERSET